VYRQMVAFSSVSRVTGTNVDWIVLASDRRSGIK